MSRVAVIFNKLEKAGTYAEDTLLLIILLGMVLLAGSQILLRNFFDYSLFWGDEMLRMMVLWITIAGGLAASRMDKHISIEVLDRFLPARAQLLAKIIIDIFTASVCGLFAWHSGRFVMSSYEFGDTLMNSAPAWMLQIILPIGFGLMAYRHLVLALKRSFEQAKPANSTGPAK
ncbi:MAG: TRAP transporter small permease subunit [Xanthomonadales bacterium]|nr:TRAP transporter small permease subunit [Xanthomonadales bacterium]